jgi:hypothetical protein
VLQMEAEGEVQPRSGEAAGMPMRPARQQRFQAVERLPTVDTSGHTHCSHRMLHMGRRCHSIARTGRRSLQLKWE